MHICLTEVYYTHVTLLQEAIAVGLEAELARFGRPDSYLAQTNAMMREKRDKMCTFLKEVGLRPIVPEGGYFVLADMTSLGKDFDTEGPDKEPYDFQLAKWMMKEKVESLCMNLIFMFCSDFPTTLLIITFLCLHFLVFIRLPLFFVLGISIDPAICILRT